MLPLVFSSALTTEKRPELESLMFFHPEQQEFSSKINASVVNFGFPKIVEAEGALKVSIEGLDVQTLYGFIDRGRSQELVGVLVYTRLESETLALIHMAVKPEFCYSSGYKSELILVRLLAQLRGIAKRIKGIKKLSIVYSDKMIPKAHV